ncbi:MAG: DUF4912 domain-containing protein [Spirochaetota bacterium]
MTKERLQSLSFHSLKEIATREGIKVTPGLSKEVLIELIIEAMEEDKHERESSNNPAISVEEKKFDITQDEELETLVEENYCIPESYNETRIVLLVRGPLWAYAYWELSENDAVPLKGNSGYEKLFLRVYETTEMENSCENIVDSFDIPIKTSDRSWYINLPKPGGCYFIKLIGTLHGREKEVCKSNVIKSPRGTIANNEEKDVLVDFVNDMMLLSGIYDFGESSIEESIPQRIISLVDAKYLN